MKKVFSMLIALVLIVSVFSAIPLADAAAPNADVGKLSEGRLLAAFKGKEKALTKAVKDEYARVTETLTADGEAKFKFGTSSEEFLHDWAGDYSCMAQDFKGGNSNATDVFSHGSQGWAAIVVPDSTANKPQAFTVRDGIGKVWTQNGGPNSNWGMPKSNQFWSKGTVYQLFDNGYASGSSNMFFDISFNEDTAYKMPGDAKPDQGGKPDPEPSKPDDKSTAPTTSNDDVSPDDTSSDDASTDGTESTESTETSEDVDAGTSSEDATDNSDKGDESDESEGKTAGTTNNNDKKLNVGKTVGIVVGAVVVLGGGGFALYWFILRKKDDLAAEGADSSDDKKE